MSSNIEFYDELRRHISEEAVMLIANRSVDTDQSATKADLEHMATQLKADMRGWMLSCFVPLWIGVYATLGALVISIVLRA